MQPIARVNPKYFAAINKFAAVGDVRYYLNGVFIEPHPEKGVVIVATDGHTLGLLHDPEGWVKEPVIIGDITKALISACAVKGNESLYTVPQHLYLSRGGAVVSGDQNVQQEVDPFGPLQLHMSKTSIVDGNFPNYRRVLDLKRDVGGDYPCINSAYLTRLHAVIKILIPNHKYGWGVELISSGRNTSTLVRLTQCDLEQRFVGLIMPMRNDGPKTPLPDWLMPKEEAPIPVETVTA